MSMLRVRNLSIQLGDLPICDKLDWQIQQGETWGILGMNGSGKTTLLHTLAGLRKPSSGEIFFNEQALSDLNRRTIAQQLGILFQDHHSEFPGTVFESALAGRHPHLHAWQFESEADHSLAMQALETVGLKDFAQRNVLTLSGGEQQRLAIACLIVQQPQLWLLDEPHNHLDPYQQIHLLDRLVEHIQHNNNSLCMSLHDVNLANRYCSHLLLMFENREILVGPRDKLLNEENLSRLYGHPMQLIEENGRQAWLPA